MRTRSMLATALAAGLCLGLAGARAGVVYEDVVLSDGPTAYWRFEEASTAVPAADSATGDGAQAGTYNSTSSLAAGRVGQALSVSPTGGGGGWVQANGVNAGEQLTAELWGRSNTAAWNAWGWLASERDGNGFIIHPRPGELAWNGYVLGSTAGSFQQIGQHAPSDVQDWHHYAITYDEATGVGLMYWAWPSRGKTYSTDLPAV